MAISYSSQHFSDINSGWLAGKVNKRFTKFNFEGQRYYSSQIEVSRSSGAKDVLPLLFTDKTFSLWQKSANMSRCALVGTLKSIPMFASSETITLFFAPNAIDDYSQKYEMRNNSIHLAGRFVRTPIEKNLSSVRLGFDTKRTLTYFRLGVNVPEANNYVSCYVRPAYKPAIEGVAIGDWIDVYGRLQSRELNFQPDHVVNSVDSVARAYQVSVAKINEIRYASSGVSYVPSVVRQGDQD